VYKQRKKEIHGHLYASIGRIFLPKYFGKMYAFPAYPLKVMVNIEDLCNLDVPSNFMPLLDCYRQCSYAILESHQAISLKTNKDLHARERCCLYSHSASLLQRYRRLYSRNVAYKLPDENAISNVRMYTFYCLPARPSLDRCCNRLHALCM
jgi:hypothetical protein